MIFKQYLTKNNTKTNIIYADMGNKRYHVTHNNILDDYKNLMNGIIKNTSVIYQPTLEHSIKVKVSKDFHDSVIDALNNNVDKIKAFFKNKPMYSMYQLQEFKTTIPHEVLAQYNILEYKPTDTSDRSAVYAFPETLDNNVKMYLVLKYGLIPFNEIKELFPITIMRLLKQRA